MATKKSTESSAKPAAKSATKSAATKSAAKAPAKKSATSASGAEGKKAPTHEEISRLAHQYWQERGHRHGSHEEDWHRAEQELKSRS